MRGVVEKRYFGRGRSAEALAQLEAIRRETRQFDRAKCKDADTRRRERLARLRGWWESINATVATAMAAAGWHQHRREWRKKRGTTVSTLATPNALPGTWVGTDLREAAGSMSPDAAAKASDGDNSALPAVKAFLHDNPAAVAMWGDVGRKVLRDLLRLHTDKDLLAQQAIMRFASDLRSRLAGPNPSALDVLVAERVVIAWAFVSWAESVYVVNLEKRIYNLKSEELALKRIDMANRHLLAACRTLAKVKRAKLPEILALVNVNNSPIPSRADAIST